MLLKVSNRVLRIHITNNVGRQFLSVSICVQRWNVMCYVSFVICYILSHHNLHILLEAFCACLVFLLLFLMILFSELPKQKHPFCIVNIILHGWSCWCVWMVSIEWPHKPQHEVENYNAIELIINTNWELWIW